MNATELQKLRSQEGRAWNEYYAASAKASQAWARYYALAKQLRQAERESGEQRWLGEQERMKAAG